MVGQWEKRSNVNTNMRRMGIVVHACNARLWLIKAGGRQIQG